MTKIATMGTSSCATIAIQGFTNKDGYDHYLEELKYQGAPVKDRKKFVPNKDAKWFYDTVLFPVIQELGRTEDMPFSLCMEQIDKGPLKTKYIVVTLNDFNFNFQNYFWPKLLRKHKFSLVSTTKNSIGGAINYVFVRNPNFNEGAMIKAMEKMESFE